MVPKIINKNTSFRNKSSYNNKNKFDNFSKSIKNANYVWKYCVKSKMKILLQEIDQFYISYVGLNVGFTVSLT